jgi:hypothetical protein
MARLSEHGTELARTEYGDCRVAVMSDGALMINRGGGWVLWKRLKTGVDPIAFAVKQRDWSWMQQAASWRPDSEPKVRPASPPTDGAVSMRLLFAPSIVLRTASLC